jgi:hypothetical protein
MGTSNEMHCVAARRQRLFRNGSRPAQQTPRSQKIVQAALPFTIAGSHCRPSLLPRTEATSVMRYRCAGNAPTSGSAHKILHTATALQLVEAPMARHVLPVLAHVAIVSMLRSSPAGGHKPIRFSNSPHESELASTQGETPPFLTGEQIGLAWPSGGSRATQKKYA